MIGRRSFITGLISLVAAPAIVRVGSIMPVKVMEPVWVGMDFGRESVMFMEFNPGMPAFMLCNQSFLEEFRMEVDRITGISALRLR